jgi:hypothetical protein
MARKANRSSLRDTCLIYDGDVTELPVGDDHEAPRPGGETAATAPTAKRHPADDGPGSARLMDATKRITR